MSQKVFDVSGFTTYLRRYNTLPGPDFTANVQQSALCVELLCAVETLGRFGCRMF